LRLFKAFLLVVFFVATAFAQQDQDYVGRYVFFAGSSHLVTPDVRLYSHGFNLDSGINVKRWLSLGVDYSRFDGIGSLHLSDLDKNLQTALKPYLNQMPGYVLDVPVDARTYTLTAGPQFNYRHYKRATLFAHPGFGMIHEVVTGKPHKGDTFAQQAAIAAVGPSMTKADFIHFVGIGGGATWKVSQHWGVRTSVDYVHCFLYKGVLSRPRNTVRLSIGPAFSFGANVRDSSVR
jgi:hypothetical protein